MKKLEFFVLNYDPNAKKVENFDIFRNIRVREGVENAVKEYLKDPDNYEYDLDGIHSNNIVKGYEAIKSHIDNIIRWQEWGRREYEISVGDAFEEDCSKLEKWDCYSQAHPNIDLITKMCIDYFKR